MMKSSLKFLFLAAVVVLSSCDTLNLFIDQENKLNREMDGSYMLSQVISENMSSVDGGWSYTSTFDTVNATGTLTLTKKEDNYCDGSFETDFTGSNTNSAFEGSYFNATKESPNFWMETSDGSDIEPFKFYSEPASIVEGHFEELEAGKSFILRVSWGSWDGSAYVQRRFYFNKK